MSDVINFIVFKQKFAKTDSAQSLLENEEPPLEYAKFYKLIPDTKTVKLYIENINRNDIETIHGELEINYLSQELVKMIYGKTYSLE